MPERELDYHAYGECLMAEKSPGDFRILRPGGTWVDGGAYAFRAIMNGDTDRLTRAQAEKLAGTLGGDLDKIPE